MDRDDVDLQKIDGKENLIDPFTKALRIKEIDDYKSKIGIVGNYILKPIM